MKFLAALSLFSLASAIPLKQRQSDDAPFTLNLRWSNSPLSGPINANGSQFWHGKDTASFCPENIPGCKTVNTTSFVGRDGQLFLNTGVPGGQQVYVSPTGLLTYTVPHSANIPEGSLTDLEVFSTNNFINPFLTFHLCSVDQEDTQWHLVLEYTNATTGSIVNSGYTENNACTRVSLEAVPYEGDTAWEFS
ncbi:uncharacterized protein EURHEDRAFT_452160 [Aspergillus ruber CBS 135680]|uniref:Uncharacterized protein n=1 Tax=Aspergillus ruber (strain CBS 135680) TaxID=1388766 RepID=A0A017SJ63_ASPRC|nr:uncharacterized protein EURHEDRAFT_452160 [Aspergillus ruber CBS 135680]EYE96801.1 hypothetical protein EURHEDRAFT_452160 [Aspergillus ruber CBS 135680]